MPATTACPAQIEANRCNAFRNGLTAQVSLMTDPERDAQEKFIRSCLAELKPEGVDEKHLAQFLALDQWRMNRIRAIGAFCDDPAAFACLSLYEQRLYRRFHRNLKLYLGLAKKRPTAGPAAPESAEANAQLPAPSTPSGEIGFVQSNRNIAPRAALRPRDAKLHKLPTVVWI